MTSIDIIEHFLNMSLQNPFFGGGGGGGGDANARPVQTGHCHLLKVGQILDD